MSTTALLLCGSLACSAGPTGGIVVGGSATISSPSSSPMTLIINQTSQNAIINWNSFNIGTGETVKFIQPNSSSISLDRVTGVGVSTINGTLTANGNVFLINPNGVLIGPGGVINTAGFVATTSNIKNSDFMAGRHNFGIAGRPDASVVNLGRITAANSGFAALVAPGVRNSGTITANLGTVALASGNTFTLDLYGDKLIQLAPGDAIAKKVIDVATGKPLSALVGNDGAIKANGGRIQLIATPRARLSIRSSIIPASSKPTRSARGPARSCLALRQPRASRRVPQPKLSGSPARSPQAARARAARAAQSG